MVNFENETVQRIVALTCAVVHYGMANHSQRNSPATYATVLSTADSFHKYIQAGTVPPRPERTTAR